MTHLPCNPTCSRAAPQKCVLPQPEQVYGSGKLGPSSAAVEPAARDNPQADDTPLPFDRTQTVDETCACRTYR